MGNKSIGDHAGHRTDAGAQIMNIINLGKGRLLAWLTQHPVDHGYAPNNEQVIKATWLYHTGAFAFHGRIYNKS